MGYSTGMASTDDRGDASVRDWVTVSRAERAHAPVGSVWFDMVIRLQGEIVTVQ